MKTSKTSKTTKASNSEQKQRKRKAPSNDDDDDDDDSASPDNSKRPSSSSSSTGGIIRRPADDQDNNVRDDADNNSSDYPGDSSCSDSSGEGPDFGPWSEDEEDNDDDEEDDEEGREDPRTVSRQIMELGRKVALYKTSTRNEMISRCLQMMHLGQDVSSMIDEIDGWGEKPSSKNNAVEEWTVEFMIQKLHFKMCR
ncbi:unnamed protein product [Cylindrotheca closterium]|uniref:Uncharacterized protein n=1 Tax=Cylindrotheca closterium TaxID=2856 RepID=A0AAD2CCL2_9STRA|nr:unnamed protein product [Cylindrotheca closterium]